MSERPLHSAAELLRLIHNLIRLGNIAEVDHAAARVRVKSGSLLTAWRPWIDGRAGTTREWDPPTVGEQCVLFSPGGDPAAAVVLVGLFSDAHPAPAFSGDLWRREMPDGTRCSYNHAAHRLLWEIGPTTITGDREHIELSSNGSTLTLDAAGIRLNGVQIEETATAIQMNGQTTVAGGISVGKGSGGGSGGIQTEGDIATSGSISADGDITAKGDITEHSG
ncbi:phage baseplate assembly protein V [Chromohalobacter israelensis]|uniref:phage baseplate assembly protein V n=1 Tax=Chromohalobacter israelensis TaxID=141390 RepID=UPI001CC6CF5C|nr:phage baseplate assembly protein V [Chromohalobacter salexigens]MBZ5876011.1 phage baseplate assembly protein V [Chromohalobacter salexigens]